MRILKAGWCRALRFNGVVAYKCTFLPALSLDMIESSYDRLVDLGQTDWLRHIQTETNVSDYEAHAHHYRITFDDGPCYDVIAAGWSAREG